MSDSPPRKPSPQAALNTPHAFALPRDLPERPEETYVADVSKKKKHARPLEEQSDSQDPLPNVSDGKESQAAASGGAAPASAQQESDADELVGAEDIPIVPRGAFSSWVVTVAPGAEIPEPQGDGDLNLSMILSAMPSQLQDEAEEAPTPSSLDTEGGRGSTGSSDATAAGVPVFEGEAESAPPDAEVGSDGPIHTARPASDLSLSAPEPPPTDSSSATKIPLVPLGRPPSSDNWGMFLPPDVPTDNLRPQFELRRMVGRGGMGEVWEAVQTSLGRCVAVKTIRPDLLHSNAIQPSANERIVREFEQEALISARLEHPNIAPVHDLGAAGPGMPPMLAMKLVRGESWQEMLRADFKAMAPADLLAKHLPILEDMAQAVGFAHSQGIIHRDLKPEQVMVGSFGETLLMDWGLAVQVSQVDDIEPPETMIRSGLPPLPTLASASNPAGTPAMMAPEQTSDSAAKLGPWTDVYLLGGTLYYLLTGGVFPHQAKSSLQALRLAMLGKVDAPRAVAPDRYIPDELAALTMHAMEAEPKKRVASVAEFIGKLQDYSSGSSRRRESEAITADAELMLHHAEAVRGVEGSALGRRHRNHAKIGAELTRAIELWGGNRRARELAAENLAQRVGAEIETGDLAVARVHLAELRDVVAERAELSMVSIVAGGTSRRSASESGTSKIMALDLAIVELEKRLASAVAERARQRKQRIMLMWAAITLLVLHAVGMTLFYMFARRSNARIAEEKQRAEDALVVAEDAKLASDLAREEEEAAREEAEGARMRAESNARAANELGSGANDLVLFVIDQLNEELETALTPERDIKHPVAQEIRGEVTASVAARVVDYFNRIDPKELTPELQLIFSQRRIEAASRLRLLGLPDQAIELTTPALSLQLELIPDDFAELATARQVLAASLIDQRRIGEAEEVIRAATEPFGVESIDEIEDAKAAEAYRGLLGRLAEVYWVTQRYKEAIAQAEEVLASHTALDDFSSEDARQAVSNLALMLGERGENDEQDRALALHKRAIALYESVSPENEEELAGAYNNYGWFLQRRGDIDGALELQQKAMNLWRELYGVSHPDVAVGYSNLGGLLKLAGRFADAEEALRTSLDIFENIYGPDSPQAGSSWIELGTVLRLQGRNDEAIAALERGLAAQERVMGPNHPQVGFSLNHLAGFYQDIGNHEKALELRMRARDIFAGSFGPDHENTVYLEIGCSALLMYLGRLDEAETLARACIEKLEASLGPEHYKVAQGHTALAEVLMRQERFDEARDESRRALGILEISLGSRHPLAVVARRTLAEISQRSGDTRAAHAAYSWLRDRAAEERKARGEDVPDMDERILSLRIAECEWDLGNTEEARELVVAIELLGFPPPNSPNLARRYDQVRDILDLPPDNREDVTTAEDWNRASGDDATDDETSGGGETSNE